MKLLIYGINYAPELTGIGKYTGELTEWLVKAGHHVEVITAMPYYPRWKITEDYRKKGWFVEKMSGVLVRRTPLYVPKKITGKSRIIHELSFMLSSQIHWLKTFFNKPDAVIAICPPFHTGFAALLYGKLWNIPVIYHIQDLQVDAAKDLGIIKNQRLLNLLVKLESWILTKSKLVSTISEGMVKKILTKGIKEEKVLLFPNWVDTSFIQPLPKSASLRKAWGFKEEDKIILYSGNLGEKQGLELLIEVAKQFQSQEDIHFLIVGEGGTRQRLIDLSKQQNLHNVHFYPLQPYEKLSALLAAADLHLVLQKRAAADLVLPSKLTSILSVGGVAVVTASAGSTLYEVVNEHNMGILVEPESVSALAEGIKRGLTTDTNLISKNARKYAQVFLSKEAILSKFEQDLKAIITTPKLKYSKV
ncbi:MAG: WcaI family glycosyltransferase [Bacteroidota bacterium]